MDKTILATQSGQQLNINVDAKTLDMCIKQISNWGSTTYQNICTGSTVIVPAGTFDWTVTILLMAGGIVILLILSTMVFKIMFD